MEATLHTNHGDITVELFPNHAPKTVANFVELATGKREWLNPETGEKILFVNSSFTTHFTNYNTPANVRFGLDKSPGSSQLLNYLTSQAMIPEYQVRFKWSRNSVAFWDNRSTQHYAVMDYQPCHRKMERTAIIGGSTD